MQQWTRMTDKSGTEAQSAAHLARVAESATELAHAEIKLVLAHAKAFLAGALKVLVLVLLASSLMQAAVIAVVLSPASAPRAGWFLALSWVALPLGAAAVLLLFALRGLKDLQSRHADSAFDPPATRKPHGT